METKKCHNSRTDPFTVAGHLYVPQTPEHFQYDADGNLTNDGRWAYAWDAENRLVGMTVNTNVGPQYQLNFAYDSKGRRIQKMVTTNGTSYTTNNFLYDGWNLVVETAPNRSAIRNYVWGTDLGGSIQGADGIGGLLLVAYHSSTATTNLIVAYDGRGNVSSLVNAVDGSMCANYEYGPFGEPIRSNGELNGLNPFRFSTKYDDDESDLLYYGYRYFKPAMGIWLSRDPIGERGGKDIYGFVKNNPIVNYDPDGKITVTRMEPDPIPANCGDYLVHFRFTLDNPAPKDGYIVQKIYMHDTWTQTDRYGHPDTHDTRMSYWEAWRVSANQTVSTTQLSPKNIGFTDASGGPRATAASGMAVAYGEVRFYYADHTGDLGDPGTDPVTPPDPKTGWSEDPNNDNYWGILPHYGDPNGSPTPSFWNDAPDNNEAVGHRWVFAFWTCSCGGTVSVPLSGAVVAYPNFIPPIVWNF